MKSKHNINILLIVFAIFAFLLPLVIALQKVLSGDIAFWYDPARDFLSAWDNLQKLTLIGPTSGIPGIFYGPYWIWLLSFGLLFSKDPQIVILLAITLPYFIFLPIILWKMSKVFDKVTVIILWLLFMLSTGFIYATNPWNPYPAPMLFILLIYFVVTTDFFEKGRQKYIKTLILGLITGLILNFHISFGVGVTVGTGLFLVMYNAYLLYFKRKHINLWKQLVVLIGLFIAGVFIAFAPFFLFEARHGFNQIQTAIKVFTTNGSVVSVTGLSDALIIQNFFDTISKLLKIPQFYSSLLLLSAAISLIYQIKRKNIDFSKKDYKLLLYLITLSCTILFLYFTSKNPVWEYHFIGVEVIFLMFIGILAHKSIVMKIVLIAIIVYTVSLQIPTILGTFQQKNVSGGGLAGKKQIVQTIQQDAKGNEYSVFAYSPSIYIYEYSYLFKWLVQKDVPYDPGSNTRNAETIYIITPANQDAKVLDFINYRAPKTSYRTIKTWQLFNDTTITKMKRI